jgi:predicted RNase H-like HicB family nuclease
MARYVALIDGEAGAYGVTVPDLPGCTSDGSTTDEALRNAMEAIRLWAEDAIAEGEELPAPRSVERLRADPEVAQAVAEGAALAIVPPLLDRAPCEGESVDRRRPLYGDRRGRRGARPDPVGLPSECRAGEDRKRELTS